MQGEYHATFPVDNAELNSTAENHSCLVITLGAACDYCVSHKTMIGYHVNLIYQCSFYYCRLDWEQIFSVGSLVYLAWGLPV